MSIIDGPGCAEPWEWQNPVRMVRLLIKEYLDLKVTASKLGASNNFSIRNLR